MRNRALGLPDCLRWEDRTNRSKVDQSDRQKVDAKARSSQSYAPKKEEVLMIVFDAKQKFQANTALSGKHREMMASPDFQAACVAALQHFNDLQTRSGMKAKTIAHRMGGARDFVGVLLNLSEVPVIPAKTEKQTLNYSA